MFVITINIAWFGNKKTKIVCITTLQLLSFKCIEPFFRNYSIVFVVEGDNVIKVQIFEVDDIIVQFHERGNDLAVFQRA